MLYRDSLPFFIFIYLIYTAERDFALFPYLCYMLGFLYILGFTCRSNPSARTGTSEAVDSISTRAAVVARVIRAFVDIDLAIGSIISERALASISLVAFGR